MVGVVLLFDRQLPGEVGGIKGVFDRPNADFLEINAVAFLLLGRFKMKYVENTALEKKFEPIL